MRRQDVQLLAFARQGDAAARFEVARRYLLGVDGFARHVPTGIDYLAHPSVADLPEAARIIAECLPLQDILALDQEKALERAAAAGVAAAQTKLALWQCTRRGELHDDAGLFRAAAARGDAVARRALTALKQGPAGETALTALLQGLTHSGDIDGPALTLQAARFAAHDADLALLARCLRAALHMHSTLTPELAELVVAAVALAERTGQELNGIEAEHIRNALDARATQGDRDAAYALGRGLCGIEGGALNPSVFADELNMRKGAAFLLRAADAGCADAWLHLYRVHADHRLSVANAQMARFFLEKAAARGRAEAQLKLGATLLRESATLAESELGIHWLHQAASQGDTLAQELLQSLVLGVEGSDEDARPAIEQISHTDPWLALRLKLARHFGLTKLEALCVDPADGLRAWGLVVGKNPFIAQARLAAPRAIPGTTPAALACAREAASFFTQTQRDAALLEGDLRRRSMRQRRAFTQHGLSEDLFFAKANATTLEALRLGPKWAFRTKEPLRLALAG